MLPHKDITSRLQQVTVLPNFIETKKVTQKEKTVFFNYKRKKGGRSRWQNRRMWMGGRREAPEGGDKYIIMAEKADWQLHEWLVNFSWILQWAALPSEHSSSAWKLRYETQRRHIIVWQKPTHHCKAIILQLKKRRMWSPPPPTNA